MPMSKSEYFFQRRKRSFTQKFFEKGLNTTAYILFYLKEIGEGSLRELPSSYPQFKLIKQMFGVDSRVPKLKKETVKTNLYRLKKQGLITKDPKRKIYYLTDKGKEFVSYIEDRYLILKKPWDGKVRIVIFDIPEEKKGWREWIRQELLLLRFHQLQKSVYIGKHPLSESFYKEIAKAGLLRYVFVFTAGEIDQRERILEILEAENKTP